MDLSVVICTCNRSASLKRTLDSVNRLFIPENLEWELIIVDNNSKDDTEEMVNGVQERCNLPILFVKEEQQGISFARNRGIREAKGRLIAFTDDDVVVDQRWIGAVVKTFSEYDVQCIGGKILPVWEKPVPAWLLEDLYDRLALLDYGNVPLYLKEPVIWGANFAVRAAAFETYGLFSTERGRLPDKLYSGEETFFMSSLLEGGESILYMPDAIVHHCISEERMRKMYFRRWMFQHGELHGLLLGDYPYENFLGIPDYIVRKLREDLSAFLGTLLPLNNKCFVHQLRIIESLGFIIGRLKYKYGKDLQ
jgi:glycosyltransferase involved in cell wall biosynthesis